MYEITVRHIRIIALGQGLFNPRRDIALHTQTNLISYSFRVSLALPNDVRTSWIRNSLIHQLCMSGAPIHYNSVISHSLPSEEEQEQVHITFMAKAKLIIKEFTSFVVLLLRNPYKRLLLPDPRANKCCSSEKIFQGHGHKRFLSRPRLRPRIFTAYSRSCGEQSTRERHWNRI